MLRGLLVLLVLANLLFFGFTRGWFAGIATPPDRQQREPERLAAQVRPQTLELVDTAAANAALNAARGVCLEAGPFDAVDLAAAENALLSAGVAAGAWQRVDAPGGATWLRVAAADAALASRLRGVTPPLIPSAFAACAAR